MLRGLQPLQLFENVTGATIRFGRPVILDEEDDDVEGSVIFSPNEEDEKEEASTLSKTTVQLSSPTTAIETAPEPAKEVMPSPSHDKEEQAATTGGRTSTEHQPISQAKTVTPSRKSTTSPHVNQTTKKRMSLAERTSALSLIASQKLVEYTESTYKLCHDNFKRTQKVVKHLQHQLQDAQRLQEEYQSQMDKASQDKKVAVRDYKRLIKQWDKYKAAEAKKELQRIEALHEGRKRRQLQDVDEPMKKSNTEDSKKRKRKKKDDSDSQSSESILDHKNSSEEEDSDWEGGVKRLGHKTGASPTSTETKRSSSRRKLPSAEWQCSACTLLNAPSLEECDACGMPR